jgi:hypothetical protein
MPILTARLGELLTITGLNASTLRSDRLRKSSVAAFGTDHPVLDERCLLLDGVAMLVRDALNAKGMARRAAAMVTRQYWPEWMEALAWVEDRKQPVVFAAAELEGNAGWWAGLGRADKLADFVAKQKLQRLLCVNMARIKIEMDTRAAKAGFVTSGGRYCLPPDDPTFVQWAKEFRAWRDAAQRLFDPLHAKSPPRPSATQRRDIEAISCSIH